MSYPDCRMEMKLILTACVVNFGVPSVQPLTRKENRAIARQGNDGGEIREYFQNLFDSIAENDAERSDAYREILQQKVSRAHHTFNAMKEEIRVARHRNSYKKRSFYNSATNKNVAVFKRATQKIVNPYLRKNYRPGDSGEKKSKATSKEEKTERIMKARPTVSPEELLKDFREWPVSQKNKSIIDTLASCNVILEKAHNKEHSDYTTNATYCAHNYTMKIEFLEKTYMTREYIETHDEVGMVREILIEEKFNQVYLNPNSSFRNLFVRHNSTADAERRKLERTAFEDAMRPMYYESRQFMWELFVRWLLETSFWTEDADTSTRLTELRDVLSEGVSEQKFKLADFIRCLLTDWDDAKRDKKKWPRRDGRRAYRDFLQMRRTYETIMKLKVGRLKEDDTAYGSVGEDVLALATVCADGMQHMFLTQTKLEFQRGEWSPISGEDRYGEDAVPEVVREWNDGGVKNKGKKVNDERHKN